MNDSFPPKGLADSLALVLFEFRGIAIGTNPGENLFVDTGPPVW
jgi:hypothetical protein